MSDLGQQIQNLLRLFIDKRYMEVAKFVLDGLAVLFNGAPVDEKRAAAIARGVLGERYNEDDRDFLILFLGRLRHGQTVTQRFAEFEREAQQLAEAGKPLTPDNAVLRALTADLAVAMATARWLVDSAADPLIGSGSAAAAAVFRQVTLAGLDDAALGVIGLRWNQIDPEALRSLIGYATNPAWQGQLSTYVSSTMNDVIDVVVRGFVAGQNPRLTARQLLDVAKSLPYHRAETLMRTVQLMSYRQGERATALANADILSHRIRIAVLDARTCMACVALHGTRLEVGEVVTDHPRGRCTSVGVVKGMTRTVQSGEDWFNALPVASQQKQMGYGAWLAWKNGRIEINDLVHRYEDDLYGAMISEASLKSLLGDEAKKYYGHWRSQYYDPLRD